MGFWLYFSSDYQNALKSQNRRVLACAVKNKGDTSGITL
nr:MAG TPA: hypothetical protein [Caudoviricetes sp.]